MATSQTGAVLKKRVSPSRPVRRADESQLEQILDLEMPRSADKLLALEVALQAVTQITLSADEVVKSLGENDLVCLMTCEGQGAGLIIADPALIAAVIEIQTLGKVSAAPVPERPATRIDVLILSDLIDRWMTDIRVAAEAQGCAAAIPFYGYSRAPRELSVRAVELMLEPVEYRAVRVSLALGGAAKTGLLTLVIPADRQAAVGSGAVGGTVGQRLEPHLMDATVVLDAVLDRLGLSLTEVLALAPGRVLEVDRERLGDIRLEADGRLLDSVRLGQLEGMRAVRMGAALDDLPMAVSAPKPKRPDIVPPPTLRAAEVPAVEDLPEAAVTDLPDLPELPDLDAGDLPELPELPDLPDLPNP